MHDLNHKIQNASLLTRLVGFYITVIVVYTLLPEPLEVLKRALSPLLLVTLAAIFWVSLGNLKRR